MYVPIHFLIYSFICLYVYVCYVNACGMSKGATLSSATPNFMDHPAAIGSVKSQNKNRAISGVLFTRVNVARYRFPMISPF